MCADYPRSSGVGRYLINKILAFAFCVGKNVIELNASPYATKFLKLPQLVHFYETAGFSSKKLHFLGKNPLFMEMVLHAEKNNDGVYQICFKKYDVKEELYTMQKHKCCTDVLIVHPELKPQLSLLAKNNRLPGRLSLNLFILYQKNNV